MHNIYIYTRLAGDVFSRTCIVTIGNDVSAKRRAFFLILEVSHDFPIGSWNFWPQVRSPDAACVLKREMNCHLQHSGFKNPETASVSSFYAMGNAMGNCCDCLGRDKLVKQVRLTWFVLNPVRKPSSPSHGSQCGNMRSTFERKLLQFQSNFDFKSWVRLIHPKNWELIAFLLCMGRKTFYQLSIPVPSRYC